MTQQILTNNHLHYKVFHNSQHPELLDHFIMMQGIDIRYFKGDSKIYSLSYHDTALKAPVININVAPKKARSAQFRRMLMAIEVAHLLNDRHYQLGKAANQQLKYHKVLLSYPINLLNLTLVKHKITDDPCLDLAMSILIPITEAEALMQSVANHQTKFKQAVYTLASKYQTDPHFTKIWLKRLLKAIRQN